MHMYIYTHTHTNTHTHIHEKQYNVQTPANNKIVSPKKTNAYSSVLVHVYIYLQLKHKDVYKQ